ncbi:nucleotide exchange factor GrpE [Candidatus Peregrinibacteria bacterium]|nr:nucleotide exchange factor GrpE [Candidatus Peregrinibacteria bacterium]
MTKKDNKKDVDLKKKLADAMKSAQAKEQKESEKVESEENGEVETLKKELEQTTELAKRTMADLQNLKRRQEEERSQVIIMANAELIKACLPVLDNLKRAKEHVPEGGEEWFKGIEMSITQLEQSFANAGLTKIEALGQPFNPDLHEALIQGPGEKDIVIEDLECGYMIGERVLRHTKVKVGNGEKA